MLYYAQLGWAQSCKKEEKENRFKTEKNINFPEIKVLNYLTNDIQKIGFWSGESSINDQSLFYYMQVYKVSLDDWECDIIKQCSIAYVNSFRRSHNQLIEAPYAGIRTQDEINEKDDYLLQRRKMRNK